MDDGPKVYSDKLRIARKPHKCCECGGIIFFREKYHVFNGLWDDNWMTFKTCQDCMDMRDSVMTTIDWDDGPNMEGLQEYIMDSGFKPDIRKFINIKDRRGAKVSKWMRELVK